MQPHHTQQGVNGGGWEHALHTHEGGSEGDWEDAEQGTDARM
jgi:hypothetical protein